jgi:hypothetical protein
MHRGEPPKEIKNQGLLGENAVAFLVSMKLAGMSYRQIQKLFEDYFKVDLCIGYLTAVFIAASVSMEEPYKEIEQVIKKQEVLNIDETTHKESGRLLYNWVFVAAALAVLYTIGTRSKDVIQRVLGAAWMGVICCDYYSVYISYAKETPGVVLSHCLAHLKRDFQYCYDHADPEISQYGEKMLDILSKLFEAWHAYKADKSDKNAKELQHWGNVLNREARNGPNRGKPKAIAKRFGPDGTPGSYTRFIELQGVEPTNNLAELLVRGVVVQRYVTQGTRGERGRHALERFWSVKGTCALQGKSFSDYLRRCMAAKNAGEPIPSLFN